jgi:hypothetical protein
LPTVDEALPTNSVEVVAGPFGRFSQLASFTQALSGVAGVSSVTTRQLYKGQVRLRLRYDGVVPLATRIAELHQFQPEILSAGPTRLELRVTVDSPGEPTLAAPSPAS